MNPSAYRLQKQSLHRSHVLDTPDTIDSEVGRVVTSALARRAKILFLNTPVDVVVLWKLEVGTGLDGVREGGVEHTGLARR